MEIDHAGETESRQSDGRTAGERSGTRQDDRHNGMDQTHEPDQSTGRELVIREIIYS